MTKDITKIRIAWRFLSLSGALNMGRLDKSGTYLS